jgi:hypothetical protein
MPNLASLQSVLSMGALLEGESWATDEHERENFAVRSFLFF